MIRQELVNYLKMMQEDQLFYNNYTFQPVVRNNYYKLYWDRNVLTDQCVLKKAIIIISTTCAIQRNLPEKIKMLGLCEHINMPMQKTDLLGNTTKFIPFNSC